MSASPQHIQLIRNSSNTATVTAGGGSGLFTFGTNIPSVVSVGMSFAALHFFGLCAPPARFVDVGSPMRLTVYIVSVVMGKLC